MQPIPLLLISDAPSAPTGLGRITRDLATRIHANLQDVFRVATLGYGGVGSRHLGFQQYSMHNPEANNWVISELPDVWRDFAGDEQGIVMTIWDASRLLWFSRPEMCPDPRLQQFLAKPPFQRWAYLPIDATGPNDRLTGILKHTIMGFDRILLYSQWALDIVERTTGYEEGLEKLPHGIDTSVFKPRHRMTARHGFGERIGAKKQDGRWVNIPDDSFAVGIVATNQARKDYGLGIQTVAELAKDRNVFLWIKTDKMERSWSIPGLLNDFGLADRTVVTIGEMSDEEMSWAYSAMDVTLGIGLGEGFSFCNFESMACGTPCIHGDYGGAAEHMPKAYLVPPELYRIEGQYNCYRPVHVFSEWARIVAATPKGKCELPAHLDWDNLWKEWERWLRK